MSTQLTERRVLELLRTAEMRKGIKSSLSVSADELEELAKAWLASRLPAHVHVDAVGTAACRAVIEQPLPVKVT